MEGSQTITSVLARKRRERERRGAEDRVPAASAPPFPFPLQPALHLLPSLLESRELALLNESSGAERECRCSSMVANGFLFNAVMFLHLL